MVADNGLIEDVDDVGDKKELIVSGHIPVFNVELPQLIRPVNRMISSEATRVMVLLSPLRV